MASIRFITDDAPAAVLTADAPGCPDNKYLIAMLGTRLNKDPEGHTRIGMPAAGTENIHPLNLTELKIPAEQPFVVYFRQIGNGWICNFSFSFVPRKDQYYEAVSTHTGLKCSAQINRLVLNADGRYERIAVTDAFLHEKMCE